MSANTSETTAHSVPPVDRAAAFKQGAPKVPRRVVYIAFAVAAMLAGFGILGEDYLSSVGLNPVPTKPPPSVAPSTAAPGAPQVGASLPAFMGIALLTPKTAPAVSLLDESGAATSLSGDRGKVVILSFFDATCRDICPVLTAELAQADVDLGHAAARVVFLTVNTDPLQTEVGSASAAVRQLRRSKLVNWHILGGSLRSLDAVWHSYGITINVSRSTGLVAHNDALYFIDPEGRLRFRSIPYANEDANGTFSLSGPSITRWAEGIATYAGRLLPPLR